MTDERQDTDPSDPNPPEGLILTEPCDEGHPALEPARFLIERWRRARDQASGRLPSRSAFAPETLGNLIGRVSLLEPIAEGGDFLYRIHAGIAADVAMLDLSRKRVSDLPYADYREAVLEQYRSAITEAVPRFDRLRLNWFGTLYDYVRVTLPVADAEPERIMLLSIMLHTDPNRPSYVSRFRSASIDRKPGEPGSGESP